MVGLTLNTLDDTKVLKKLEKIKIELRARGMDNHEIQKYIEDIKPNLEVDSIELEFFSNEKLYATKMPLEIDESEMPASVKSDYTTRSKKRKQLLDLERSARMAKPNYQSQRGLLMQTDEHLIKGSKIKRIPRL